MRRRRVGGVAPKDSASPPVVMLLRVLVSPRLLRATSRVMTVERGVKVPVLKNLSPILNESETRRGFFCFFFATGKGVREWSERGCVETDSSSTTHSTSSRTHASGRSKGL